MVALTGTFPHVLLYVVAAYATRFFRLADVICYLLCVREAAGVEKTDGIYRRTVFCVVHVNGLGKYIFGLLPPRLALPFHSGS